MVRSPSVHSFDSDPHGLYAIRHGNVEDARSLSARNYTDAPVAFQVGAPNARGVGIAALSPESLLEVRAGDAAFLHPVLLNLPIFDQQHWMALDEWAEPVEVVGEGCQQPVHPDEHQASQPGREEIRRIGDSTTHD